MNMVNDLFVLLGYGKFCVELVLKYLIFVEEVLDGEDLFLEIGLGWFGKMIKEWVGGKSGIWVADLDDVVVRFFKCCNFVFGDVIVGFVICGCGVVIYM